MPPKVAILPNATPALAKTKASTSSQWIIVILIIVVIAAFVGCVLQIIWIRNKLGNYSRTQMSALLTTQSQLMVQLAIPQSTMQVYSLVVDVQLTVKINTTSTPANSFLQPLVVPRLFSVPQTCGAAGLSSNEMSCNKVGYIVTTINDSSANLINDLQSGGIMYVMVGSTLYLAYFSQDFQDQLQVKLPEFTDTYVVYLYTIISQKNLPTVTGCTVGLVPFFGSISNDSSQPLTKVIGITDGSKAKSLPVHAMAFMLPKPPQSSQ